SRGVRTRGSGRPAYAPRPSLARGPLRLPLSSLGLGAIQGLCHLRGTPRAGSQPSGTAQGARSELTGLDDSLIPDLPPTQLGSQADEQCVVTRQRRALATGEGRPVRVTVEAHTGAAGEGRLEPRQAPDPAADPLEYGQAL